MIGNGNIVFEENKSYRMNDQERRSFAYDFKRRMLGPSPKKMMLSKDNLDGLNTIREEYNSYVDIFFEMEREGLCSEAIDAMESAAEVKTRINRYKQYSQL